MHRQLNVPGDLYLINLNWFNYIKNNKKGAINLEFKNGDKLVTLAKKMSKTPAPKTLADRFDGFYTIRNFLDIGEASPVLEQSLKATTKFKRELPIDTEMESVSVIQFPSLAGDMHIKTQQTW